MKFWMTLALIGIIGYGTSAHAFSTRHDVLSFSCVTTTTTGVSRLSFDRSKTEVVEAIRTLGSRYEYELHQAGEMTGAVWQGKQHLTLSGGPLRFGQYVALVFQAKLRSGNNQVAGSVYLVGSGGSVFAPIVASMVPIGTFHCSSLVIR